MPISLNDDDRDELMPKAETDAKATNIIVNVPPIEIPAVRLNPVINMPVAPRLAFRMEVVERDYNRDIKVAIFTPIPAAQ